MSINRARSRMCDWRLTLVATLVILGLGAAACGDDGSETASTNTTSAETTDATDDTSGSGTLDCEEPIKIMQLGDYQSASGSWPEQLDGAQAAAASINAAGGANGCMIEIIDCDTKGDVNAGTTCAREGVDEGIVAAVGGQVLSGEGVVEVFEAANIAHVGVQPLAPPDFTSPISFPLVPSSGYAIGGICAATVEVSEITEGIVIFGVDVPAGRQAVQLCVDALDIRDVESSSVFAPPGAPDFSAFVAEAMGNDPQAVILSILPQDVVQIATAFQQAGYEGEYGTVSALVTSSEDLIDPLAELIAPAYVTALVPPVSETDNPELAPFFEDMEGYAPDARLSGFSLNAWISVYTVAEILEGMSGPVDNDTFFEAINSANDVEVPVLGIFDFTQESGIEGQERIFNPKVFLARFTTDGTFEQVGSPFDPYDPDAEIG